MAWHNSSLFYCYIHSSPLPFPACRQLTAWLEGPLIWMYYQRESNYLSNGNQKQFLKKFPTVLASHSNSHNPFPMICVFSPSYIQFVPITAGHSCQFRHQISSNLFPTFHLLNLVYFYHFHPLLSLPCSQQTMSRRWSRDSQYHPNFYFTSNILSMNIWRAFKLGHPVGKNEDDLWVEKAVVNSRASGLKDKVAKVIIMHEEPAAREACHWKHRH